MEEVVRATASDSGTTVTSSDDATASGGSSSAAATSTTWSSGINAVSGALETGGYGDRVLCAVFAFEDARKRAVYWIYNYKRGSFYPFGRPPAPSSATTSASSCSRRRSARTCRSSRSSSGGSHSGEPRSEGISWGRLRRRPWGIRLDRDTGRERQCGGFPKVNGNSVPPRSWSAQLSEPNSRAQSAKGIRPGAVRSAHGPEPNSPRPCPAGGGRVPFSRRCPDAASRRRLPRARRRARAHRQARHRRRARARSHSGRRS